MSTIDAVITWVDGSERLHREKRLQAMSSQKMTSVEVKTGAESTRFEDNGEIYYCIASILKHAPFIKKIYVVTDNQVPEFLDDFQSQGICADGTIKIVDHKDIFGMKNQYYPTFNSLSIESLICNINGISDFFLYFNDDVFLLEDIKIEDFISSRKKPFLRGNFFSHPESKPSWGLKSAIKRLRNQPIIDTFGINQSNSAKLIGMDQYFRVGHCPHIVRSKTLKNFFNENKEILDYQLRFKFRSNEQYSPISIANHIEIMKNQAEFLPLEKSVYIKPNTVNKKRLEAIWSKGVRFGCIQSLDQFPSKWKAKTHDNMRKKFDGYLPSSLINL